MVLNNIKWRQLLYFYSRGNFINSWEIQSDSRFLYRRPLRCDVLAARRPRAQRGCRNEPVAGSTPLRNPQRGAFVRCKSALLCRVLPSGPGKGVLRILVDVEESCDGSVSWRGGWSSPPLPRQPPWPLCSSATDSPWVETWDRSLEVRIGKHLVHIYPEKFASDTNCLGRWREGVYFSSIFSLGAVSELEVIN